MNNKTEDKITKEEIENLIEGELLKLKRLEIDVQLIQREFMEKHQEISLNIKQLLDLKKEQFPEKGEKKSEKETQ